MKLNFDGTEIRFRGENRQNEKTNDLGLVDIISKEEKSSNLQELLVLLIATAREKLGRVVLGEKAFVRVVETSREKKPKRCVK